jgi:hypothetical protein
MESIHLQCAAIDGDGRVVKVLQIEASEVCAAGGLSIAEVS